MFSYNFPINRLFKVLAIFHSYSRESITVNDEFMTCFIFYFHLLPLRLLIMSSTRDVLNGKSIIALHFVVSGPHRKQFSATSLTPSPFPGSLEQPFANSLFFHVSSCFCTSHYYCASILAFTLIVPFPILFPDSFLHRSARTEMRKKILRKKNKRL